MSLAEALLVVQGQAVQIAETVAGYRVQLERDHGFSVEAAEAMAVDLHAQIVETCFRAAT